ncbi:AAA family ATPase [Baekduia sp.]|jgi:predicted ATPase|uniref:AAA family ATPase n=1 Tax=Baekduia sp. TaxID=2600305 RepID=UPI002E091797|nr:AAA family ATPase [Baekduia sp.]
MYIKRVELSDVKSFKNAQFDFCPEEGQYAGWAVITGDNGAGKTALLRAIALALLGPDQSRGLVQDFSGWAQTGEERGAVSVEVKPHHEWDSTRRGGAPLRGTFWAEIQIYSEDNVWRLAPVDIRRNKRVSAQNGPWQPSTNGWFSLGYGPFRRLYGSSPDAQRLMVLPGRVPHYATLFKEDATLGEGEEWIKDLQYQHLEEQSRREQDGRAGRQLAGLLMLLNDHFLRQGAAVEEVNSQGVWLRDAAGRRIALSDMSEGYRAALAMLIDIFRHMSMVYGPDIVASQADGSVFVARPGVVLIDEVDAHLHPDWQRDIGFWLKSHFPNVQFIVTTHSPLVCPAADYGRIYHLPQPGKGEAFRLSTEDYNEVVAGKPDEILLTPAFGLQQTRSPRAVRARNRHALLQGKRLTVGLSADETRELEQLALFAASGT